MVGLCVLGRGCDRLTDEIIYILFSFFPDMSSVRVGGNGITGLHMQLFGGGKTLPKNIKDSVNQLRGAIQVRAFLALGGRTHTHTHTKMRDWEKAHAAQTLWRKPSAQTHAVTHTMLARTLCTFSLHIACMHNAPWPQAALQNRCSRMDVEMPYAANFGVEQRKTAKVVRASGFTMRVERRMLRV